MPPAALCRQDLLRKLMNALVLFPVGLEAVLAAEIGRRHPELDAGRAGQRLVYDLGAAGRGAFAGHSSDDECVYLFAGRTRMTRLDGDRVAEWRMAMHRMQSHGAARAAAENLFRLSVASRCPHTTCQAA